MKPSRYHDFGSSDILSKSAVRESVAEIAEIAEIEI